MQFVYLQRLLNRPFPKCRFFCLFLSGLIAVVLSGCSVSRTALFPPEQADKLALEEASAGREYVILGVIQVDGHNFSTDGALVAKLRAKAKAIGADDVVRVRVMSLPRGEGFIKYHLPTAEGIAVRWKSPPQTVQGADPAKKFIEAAR